MKIRSLGVLLGLGVVVLGAGSVLQAKRSHASLPLETLDNINPISAPAPKAHRIGGAEDDANTARVTAMLLSHDDYVHLQNATVSSRLLDHYLDALDPLHLFFLQSDLQEFEKFRPKLDTMILDSGDTSPANQIFQVFLQRVDQQIGYVNDQLKAGKFDFTGNDSYTLDRKNAPRPSSLDEAKQLWRQHLRYEYLEEKLSKQKPEEQKPEAILQTLTKRYSRISRTLHELDTDDVFQLYLDSLAHAYDPHTDYMNKATLDNFDISMRLSLVGIGALLDSVDGYCTISELIPGGPAMKSNQLKAGDRIIAVGQGSNPPVDVIDMKLDKVVDMIRGKKGTEVRLTVIPAGTTDTSTRKVVTLIRDEVKLEEQEAKARIIDLPADKGKALRLGVIDLPSFYEDMGGNTHKSTTDDVARLLRKLKTEKVDGIVLDLRNNGGGSLKEVIRLTRLFVKPGPVVQVRDPDGQVSDPAQELHADRIPDPADTYYGPMVVLTSRLSASASEIMAGALQDYGRAVIVGDTSTFGKGTVQAMIPLGSVMRRSGINTAADPGAVKLTIQKFYRPSGASTQLRGVVPDIVLPSVIDVTDIGEKALENPLPWDTVPSATFQKMNLVPPVVEELRKRSEARQASDSDFIRLREVIAQAKKLKAQKSVSLNEQQRKQEKQDAEARNNAWKKELKARPASKEKVYLLTLAQADQPGLPPAMKPEDAKKNDAAKPNPANTPDAATGDDTLPKIDLNLEEAKHILTDLIALSPRTAAAR